MEVPNKLANGPGLSLLKARSQRFPGGAQSCVHYYSLINFGQLMWHILSGPSETFVLEAPKMHSNTGQRIPLKFLLRRHNIEVENLSPFLKLELLGSVVEEVG